MTWPSVDTAALVAALGLPAWKYLTGSAEERVLLGAVADKALELRKKLDQRLAVEISNAQARAQRG